MNLNEALNILKRNGYILENFPPADQWIYIICKHGIVLKVWAWNTEDAFEQAEKAGFIGEEYKLEALHYDYVIKNGKIIK